MQRIILFLFQIQINMLRIVLTPSVTSEVGGWYDWHLSETIIIYISQKEQLRNAEQLSNLPPAPVEENVK